MLQQLSKNVFWQEVSSLLNKRSLAILFGAGLSRSAPCRLPLFNELLGSAIKNLSTNMPSHPDNAWPPITVDHEAVSTPYDSIPLVRTRPEFTFSILSETCKDLVPWLSRVFSTQQFSTEHLAIASLLKNGNVSQLATTNFDPCMENALAHLGLHQGVDYALGFDASFDTHSVGLGRKLLLKLHGTSAVPSSMRITLEHEYRQLVAELSMPIEDGTFIHMGRNEDAWRGALVEIAKATPLLVLGYSGRDAQFDRLVASPELAPVFWLAFEHVPSAELDSLKNRLSNIKADVYLALGNISDVVPLANVPATSELQEGGVPHIYTAQPELRYTADEAVLAWVILCRNLFPNTLRHVLQDPVHPIWRMARSSPNMAYIIGGALRAMGKVTDSIKMYEMAGNNPVVRTRLALTFADQGDFHRAEAIFNELEQEGGWGTGLRSLAWAKFHHAEYLRLRGHASVALNVLRSALEYSQLSGDRSVESSIHNSLGIIMLSVGRDSAALTHFRQSLDIKEQLGARHELGNSYNNLAVMYRKRGDLQTALEWMERSADWKSEHGDQFGLGSAYTNLAGLHFEIGNLERAEALARRSIEQKRQVNDLPRLPTSLLVLGAVLAKKGDVEAAFDVWEECAECVVAVGATDVGRQLAVNVAVTRRELKSSRGVASKANQVLAVLKLMQIGL